MSAADFQRCLAHLAEEISPDEAQRWLQALREVPGEPLREEFRRSLLRLALLERCVATEGWRAGLDESIGRASLRGVAVVLSALEDGLVLRDTYTAQGALYDALSADDPDVWLEAASLAERGRGRWEGGLADALQGAVVQQLAERGELIRAKALLPRVCWPLYTVEAVRALWPHGDGDERARWLAHADVIIASAKLPRAYQVQPLSDLVLLVRSPERLAALEALVASLSPAEIEELDPSCDNPKLSLALARQGMGLEGWTLLAPLPVGFSRWQGAIALASRLDSRVEKAALIEQAWETLLAWPEASGSCVAETLALDPAAGAARARAWFEAALDRGDTGCGLADLLLAHPRREELAARLVSWLEDRGGEQLTDGMDALATAGFDHLLGEHLRERLWAGAPAIEEDHYWWRDAVTLLPERVWETALERMLEAHRKADHYTLRDNTRDGLLALGLLMEEPTQARIAQALASVAPLVPRGARRDGLVQERLLHCLGFTLPASVLAPRAEILRAAVGETVAARMFAHQAPPAAPPLRGDEAIACRAALQALLARPGWLSFEVSDQLVMLAVSLEGEQIGGALLDDVLAWRASSR